MNLIENIETLVEFIKSKPVLTLLIPVWSSHKGHECGTDISFIYWRTADSDGIINFKHIDANGVAMFPIHRLCNQNTLVLGNRYIDTIGLDYEWVYFEEYGTPFVFNEFVESVYRGYRRDFNELNDCVPLTKWYEVLGTISDITTRQDWYRNYSDSITELGKLEGAGVKVVEEKFIDKFGFNPAYITSGIVYPKYNPYTTTGRPTNRHLNVNWSAMPKTDGGRQSIVSRFKGGTLLAFDWESYHIRLIGRLVGYDFPTDKTAHQHLAEWYGPGVTYDEAKGITFRYLYGGWDETSDRIPFFAKVREYIREGYKRFIVTGGLTTPIFGRRISFQRIEAPNEGKVFNYLLQSLETEINYRKIREINQALADMESCPTLYTYDSILIDTHPAEREDVLKTIRTIMERGGFPVRAYEGSNYEDLVVLS